MLKSENAFCQKSQKYLSTLPEETEGIGRKIAQDLQAESIVCLTGDLGAGKATLC